jgi:hypothetical protein
VISFNLSIYLSIYRSIGKTKIGFRDNKLDEGAGLYVGTPNVGVGAYANVTTNAACQQIRGH